MIISTGMRTDIPAFYSKWLLNRIKAGFVYVRNPYNEHQITKYSLNPSVVDCLCFCTKNPLPLIPHLDELSSFKQFWYVTITPYGKDIEPNVPDKQKILEGFKEISKKVGVDAIGWRYEPVFYDYNFNLQKHIEEFSKIARALKGYTKICSISFLDLYEKIKRNTPNIYPPNLEEQKKIGKAFSKIAEENGMKIHSCCEGVHLAEFGVDVGGCQTKEMLEKAIGANLIPPKMKNQRGICSCLLGNDIGEYNTCGHLCKYCYANCDKDVVLSNMKKHNPNSPLLIGNVEKGDKVVEAKQKSYLNLQIKMEV